MAFYVGQTGVRTSRFSPFFLRYVTTADKMVVNHFKIQPFRLYSLLIRRACDGDILLFKFLLEIVYVVYLVFTIRTIEIGFRETFRPGLP